MRGESALSRLRQAQRMFSWAAQPYPLPPGEAKHYNVGEGPLCQC